MILALDLGTKNGWCLGDPRGDMAGTENFQPGRYQSSAMRFVRFRRWLGEILKAYRVDRVVFEEVRRHMGVDAAHAYGGYLAHMQELCEDFGIDYEGIPVGTIKKHATGKGNSNKELMMSACIREFGVVPTDDNEADARWLLDYVLTRDDI